MTTGGETTLETEAVVRVRLTLTIAAVPIVDLGKPHWSTVAGMELMRYVFFCPWPRKLELMTHHRLKRPNRMRHSPRSIRRQSGSPSLKHGRRRKSSRVRSKKR
jgi:hypothetical protein